MSALDELEAAAVDEDERVKREGAGKVHWLLDSCSCQNARSYDPDSEAGDPKNCKDTKKLVAVSGLLFSPPRPQPVVSNVAAR